MTWKKIHVEIEYSKLDFHHSSYSSFSSPGPFFSSVFFCGFFFCRFLSFLCLGSFLFLQVPFFFFTMGFFLLHVLSGSFFSSVFSRFFCRFLSFLCLDSFLFLQIPFFFFTMGFFLLRVLSILVGTILLLPLWVTLSSFLLQF